jgi:hypothetical protein
MIDGLRDERKMTADVRDAVAVERDEEDDEERRSPPESFVSRSRRRGSLTGPRRFRCMPSSGRQAVNAPIPRTFSPPRFDEGGAGLALAQLGAPQDRAELLRASQRLEPGVTRHEREGRETAVDRWPEHRHR